MSGPASQSAGGSLRETDDNYSDVVARLNHHFRVIRCRDAIQLVLQVTDGTKNGQSRWTGRSYCMQPATVHRLVLRHCGIVDAAELEKLQRLSRVSNHNDR